MTVGFHTKRRGAAMHAARNGHVDALKELIAAKADLSSKDNGGVTAAMHAEFGGHVEALRIINDEI